MSFIFMIMAVPFLSATGIYALGLSWVSVSLGIGAPPSWFAPRPSRRFHHLKPHR